MIDIMCILSFVLLGVCKPEPVNHFTRYRILNATVPQNVSESTMMTTIVGCDHFYSSTSTRAIVYDATLQLCRLYEQNDFPLMILPAPSPPRTLYVKGTIYALVQTPMTWINARLNCEANGGQLIKFESSEKHDMVAAWLRLYDHPDASPGIAWIGLNDRSTEGSFSWVDGTSLGNFSFWQPNEPNNLQGEDCVDLIFMHGKWNDRNCEGEFWSLCEYN